MRSLTVRCRSCGGSIPVVSHLPEGAEVEAGSSEALRFSVKCPQCHIPGSYAFREAIYEAEESG